jgi:seryl-tRNA(Sec) selenium transferase
VAIRRGSEAGAVALARKLRSLDVPVLSRIKGDEVRLNLRSVMPYEDAEVSRVLGDLLGKP